MCVFVEGWVNKTSPQMIEAKTIKVVTCPQPTQTWDGVVRSTNCDSNIAYVMIDNTTYTVTLPKGFSCSRLQSGMCVKITGRLHPQSNIAIIATDIQIVDCPLTGQTWTMFLTKTDCKVNYYYALDGRKAWSIKLPTDFKCSTFYPGSCIKVTGTIESTIGVRALYYIKATKIEQASCPNTYTTMKVKIVGLYCTGYNDAQNIVVERDGIQYTCYVTSYFDCTQFEVGDCATISGYFDTSNYYGYLTGIQKTDCGSGFTVTINTVYCTKTAYRVNCYIGQTLYTLYLPQGFDCSSLAKGDCYYIIGTKDDNKKTIIATSMKKVRC